MSGNGPVYKFQLNQMVRLVRAPLPTKSGIAPSEYEVVRLMPADASGAISYRVRAGSAELAVREHEIKA